MSRAARRQILKCIERALDVCAYAKIPKIYTGAVVAVLHPHQENAPGAAAM